MEDVETTVSNTRKSFTEHVLNFDDSTKSEMMNIGQYTVLALIPVLMLNKVIQVYSPEADDSKHSAEIALEVISQTIVLFIGMFFIHRLVTFVPTYSGDGYKDINILSPALGFLVIVLSIQSRIGEKMNILYERFMELLGYGEQKQVPVRKSQPIQGTPMQHEAQPHMQPHVQPTQPHIQPQIQPTHDIRGDAHQPQQPQQHEFSHPQEDMFQEPMAANEAMGGMGVAF